MVNTNKKHWKTKEIIWKPDIVVDYNTNMRLIDKADMQISTVDSLRKSTKWYRKIYFHLMDICMLNAYNLYMTKTGERSTLRAFKLNVITEMLRRFGQQVPTHSRSGRQRDALQGSLQRLNGGVAFHCPVHVPPTAANPRKMGQRECIVDIIFLVRFTIRGSE
uniref:PiggyBac transposable element-derived protein domain-containing protein n=1 Tax=Scylla olivacea TaxID=85551 RepID=A0A0P4VWV7_SCYOL